jgi:4-hydroxybenzoate polyprenyltransferase
MCLNRITDREIDARNPRTKNWALVTGAVAPSAAWAAVAGGLSVLFVAAAALNRFCLLLSPVAFALLFLYPYLKRITAYSHLGIGLVLACAPLGGWAAARGRLDADAFLLAAAVLFWVAGFDIYYSLQDEAFDRGAGLRSIPARWGGARAVRVARFFHFLTLIFLGALGIMESLNWIYWVGLLAAVGILLAEYILMRELDLKNVGPAFFTMNSLVSSGFFLITVGSVLTSR